MCPLSVALFERFTVCSAKMTEPIDGKASNRLRYTLSVYVKVAVECLMFAVSSEKPEPASHGTLSDSANNMAVAYVCKVTVSVVKMFSFRHD